MTEAQERLIYGLLIASVGFVVVPIVWGLVRWIASLFFPGIRKKSGFNKKLVIFSAFLIGAIWCLRYAVEYYSIRSGASELTPPEELFNSMVHALQTFSMDEDYTQYILDGKAMLGAIAGTGSVWVTFYGLYASVLNFAAPLAGGAILFEVLASIFPKVKLRTAYMAVWRPKYYFSELNEGSLTLAKSIIGSSRRFRAPILVFTDVYVDDEDEKQSEILHEARRIGAICLRSDLARIPKNRFGKREFYLIDEAGIGNLHTLSDLSDENNYQYLKKAHIYLFAQDDAYTQVERRIRERLKTEYRFTDDEIPTVIPIFGYKNLVTNLLFQLPLYEPLVHKKRSEKGKIDLTVTILGSGSIGTEMFLAVYWIGQMLDVSLTINVVSKDSERSFRRKIDYINPEIWETTKKNSPKLEYRDGRFSEPYCRVNYIEADVKSGEFLESGSVGAEKLSETDYFMVALGSDEDNLSVAERLYRSVGEEHIRTDGEKKAVIAYVIYDSGLCETLNRQRIQKEVPGVYMVAFGSLDEVYSCENVFMTKYALWAKATGDEYLEERMREDQIRDNRKRIEKDEYNYWANLARAMHVKYKVYSLGWIKTSVFDGDGIEHRKASQAACAQLKRIAANECLPGDADRKRELLDHGNRMLHRLAWLEHRRWNAFTRTKGYRGTKAYERYQNATGSYKHMPLKLHPCLLECSENGILAKIDENCRIDRSTTMQQTDRSGFDRLDALSYHLKDLGYCDHYDFKIYDYLEYEFI